MGALIHHPKIQIFKKLIIIIFKRNLSFGLEIGLLIMKWTFRSESTKHWPMKPRRPAQFLDHIISCTFQCQAMNLTIFSHGDVTLSNCYFGTDQETNLCCSFGCKLSSTLEIFNKGLAWVLFWLLNGCSGIETHFPVCQWFDVQN